VLAAEVVELSRGAKLAARTSDISRSGCYIDTLNPVPRGSRIRVRFTHHLEVFEAVARVVYTSYGLGMGVVYETVSPDELAKLERWLAETGAEF
jgi:Ribonuclease G/E